MAGLRPERNGGRERDHRSLGDRSRQRADAALTSLVDEGRFHSRARSGEEGALEGLGTQYEGALAEITRLAEEAAAGACDDGPCLDDGGT